MTFQIPNGHRVRLDAGTKSLDIPPADRPLELPIPELSKVETSVDSGKWSSTIATVEMLGTKGVHGGTTNAAPSLFGFKVARPVRDSAEFTVNLPDMIVDDAPAHVDPIKFVLKSGTHLAGLCQ